MNASTETSVLTAEALRLGTVPVPVPELSGDPVSEAALTGAALVSHLDDVRFAALRALRQLLRALDAERIAFGRLDAASMLIQEELAWVSGFGRCGESERRISCRPFVSDLQGWLASSEEALCVRINRQSPAWHELPCDRLLLVRSPAAEAQPCRVLVAQLRGYVPLPGPAPQAMALLLHAYDRRCGSVQTP